MLFLLRAMNTCSLQSACVASAERPLSVLWQKPKILGVSSAAACGGLLFGYDLGELFFLVAL